MDISSVYQENIINVYFPNNRFKFHKVNNDKTKVKQKTLQL